MITAERLEELIKQGATIYCIMNSSKYISDFGLSIGNFTVASDCPIIVELEVIGYVHGYGFEQLFETKEQAEWHLKNDAERIERFQPPMWEDLVTPYQFTFILRCKKDSRDMGTYALYVYQSGIMIEEDIEAHAQHYLFDKDFTKENYIKACEIVRDLFNKGGVK